MAHEVGIDDLSAFLDGELSDERKAQVSSHLRDCASCARQLEGFRRTSVAFRAHAKETLPAGFVDRVLRRLRPKRREFESIVEWGLVLAVTLGIILFAGVTLKRFMPGLFSQIQSMISGAAGSLGQGNQ